jgi:predicted NAD-dependent protein-ADP-ribosyltransferase YbiA (DUF1768 family)
VRVERDADGLSIVAETDGERGWLAGAAGDVFHAVVAGDGRVRLERLGPRATACREPINVWAGSPDPALRLIGNFAATPFVLDDAGYASVEGFWQGLRCASPAERRRIATLDGEAAKAAGEAHPYGAVVRYDGREIPVGTWAHWELMRRACWAKFTQHAAARAALLATAPRPIEHRVPRDSRTIPGVVMADIWMEIRARLLDHAACSD